MKKNFSVNIGKRLFNIDEDAYESLSSYMGRLQNFFRSDNGREEILSDIEMRIAELLEQKVNQQGQALVVLEYIEQVIREMGEPGQLSGEGDPEGPHEVRRPGKGRLFRDPSNRYFGGVAAGIAAWFDIPAGWVRLIFLVASLFYGIGPVVYVILWLILPEARTTSDKLAMQRQLINIGNLRKEINAAGNGIKNSGNTFLRQLSELLRNFFEIAARLTRWVFQMLGRISGLILLLLVVLAYIGLGLSVVVRDDVGMNGYRFDSVTLYQVYQWMVPAASDRWLFYLSFILVLVSLSGLLIYAGLRLLLKWPPLKWPVVVAFVLMLLAGFLTAGAAFFRYSGSAGYTASSDVHNRLPMPENRLHIIAGSWDAQQWLHPLTGSVPGNAEAVVMGEINLSFRPAPGDSLLVTLIKTAAARSKTHALDYASDITYTYAFSDSLLTINPYFFIPYSDGMRYQEINMIVGIPLKREVDIDHGICWKARYSDFHESENDGGIYRMTSSGLVKVNIPAEEADSLSKSAK